MTPNRSPSPLSSRNFRNSEVNSTSRKSFNGNPFSRPNSLINPKSSDPFTPANTPTATDHTKRNPITRKSIGGGSMFQDGKENRKDAFRSPAKTASKNFMSPTISAASKFTPSPRKRILGDRNDGTLRASIGFSNNDESVIEPGIDEQKEESVVENPCVDEVNLSSTNDDSGFGNIVRPLCCSPITDSPIVPVTDSDPNLPPYDPKKNFLSPRPQFLRYKPNPRIEFLLNKEDNNDYGEDDVTRLEDTFNLSDNSSDTEDKEPEKEDSFNLSDNSLEEKEPEKEGELGDDSVHGTESVLDENPFDLKVDKASKPRFFTVSKAVLFVFVLFLVACFSLSFTESPPVDLPIYEDIGFSEIYLGSLRFVAFAKESFDDLVENVRQWVIDQNSHYFPTHNIGSIQFFNLTTSPIQEEFQFNRHIGTDYIQEIQEFQEFQEEEDTEVVDNESEIDEVVAEEPIYEQILSEIDESVTEEPINDQIQSEIVDIVETKSNPDEVQSEMVENVEIESSVADINEESEASGALSSQSIATICVAGVSMVVMAVATAFYMNQKKSITLTNDYSAREESGSSERSSSNMQKGYKKKTNNKRESLASSSSDFSMSDSFGSFTTFERIAIKHKDEVMLTPIRRSSRLLKNQAISS